MLDLKKLKDYDQTLNGVYPEKFDWGLKVDSLTGSSYLKENSLTFIKNKKFFDKFQSLGIKKTHNIGIIFDLKFWNDIANTDDWKKLSKEISFALTSEDINLSISWLSEPFYKEKSETLNNIVDGRQMGSCDIHPTAWIAQGVFIGENVNIGANVVIQPGAVIMGEVEIGEGTIIYPNVTIYPWVKIGKNCRFHSGVTIGADGFGYNFHQGQHLKVWHFGGVEIQDNVEIGSNSNVDMGTFNPTIIGNGSKIDSQVHIGHNNILGTGVIICGQAGTAGSAKLGNYTVLGGDVSIGPDVTIGDQAQIAGAAKVLGDVPEKGKFGGHPARPINEWLRGIAFIRKQSLKK